MFLQALPNSISAISIVFSEEAQVKVHQRCLDTAPAGKFITSVNDNYVNNVSSNTQWQTI